MGYTKFALKNLVTPGDIMPRCNGDRVFEVDLETGNFITMNTTTQPCLFVIVPYDYDNTPIPWDLSNISMKRHSCNEVSVFLQPNCTFSVQFNVPNVKKIHVYTYDSEPGHDNYYPTYNKVPNCSSVSTSA